jgi:hypothetical protein
MIIPVIETDDLMALVPKGGDEVLRESLEPGVPRT